MARWCRQIRRERVPLDWAMTQDNLGDALATLSARESGTARLEAAVAAYREALKEWTRENATLSGHSPEQSGPGPQAPGEAHC